MSECNLSEIYCRIPFIRSVFIEMQFYYLVFIYRNKKKIKAKRTNELVLPEFQYQLFARNI